MNKVIEMTTVSRDGTDDSYTKDIAKAMTKLQDMGLEIELHYAENSSVILGRKIVYDVREL